MNRLALLLFTAFAMKGSGKSKGGTKGTGKSKGKTTQPKPRAFVFMMREHPFDKSDYQVLLLHHRETRQWMLPGGEVDSGETFFAAAKREYWEETGEKSKLPILEKFTAYPEDRNYKIYVGVAKKGFEFHFMTNKEANNFDWVSVKDIMQNRIPKRLLRNGKYWASGCKEMERILWTNFGLRWEYPKHQVGRGEDEKQKESVEELRKRIESLERRYYQGDQGEEEYVQEEEDEQEDEGTWWRDDEGTWWCRHDGGTRDASSSSWQDTSSSSYWTGKNASQDEA